jgi:cytochrome c oxidase subunit 4
MSDEHTHHHANYFLVFAALCVLTGLSVIADVVHIPSKLALIVIVLAVATAKALFVMTYFMHLKFEGNWKFVLLAPTIILACGLPLALLPDVGVHYYDLRVPQTEQTASDHEDHDEPRGESSPTAQPH